MGRFVQDTSPTESMPTIVLLAHAGVAGSTKEYTFTNGSIRYFEKTLKNAFDYTLIDNIGSGLIRISYNRPALEITSYTDGAKTLKSNDAFYAEEEIWYIKIYFIEASTVEIVLKSTKLT